MIYSDRCKPRLDYSEGCISWNVAARLFPSSSVARMLYSGGVAARFGQTGDQPGGDDVVHDGDDRDRFCRLFAARCFRRSLYASFNSCG
jgi:hypothetical protein